MLTAAQGLSDDAVVLQLAALRETFEGSVILGIRGDAGLAITMRRAW